MISPWRGVRTRRELPLCCNRHGAAIGPATRILARWPEIGAHDIYTAAAAGNIAGAVLKRLVAADPAAASRKRRSSQMGTAAFISPTRELFTNGDAPAIKMANILLDHGADPNATIDDGWGNPFKVHSRCDPGRVEGDKPPHPHANELALLLIERPDHPPDFPGALQYVYHTR